jgi:hypothetical protein
MSNTRQPSDAPAAIARDGWQFHHVGIPRTDCHPDERHIEHLGIHVHGFDTSAYGVEWMRFDPECHVPELVRTVPHVAFVVPDLDEALEGKQILIAPNEPSPGVRVAFIVDDAAPVELLEFREESRRRRRGKCAVARRGAAARPRRRGATAERAR